MITAIVEFPLGEGATREKAAALFEASAARYQGMKGLVRKYYLFDEASRAGGGVYLWESRAHAEAVYTDEWKAMIEERYGTKPQIRFFDTPVIVDNAKGSVEAT